MIAGWALHALGRGKGPAPARRVVIAVLFDAICIFAAAIWAVIFLVRTFSASEDAPGGVLALVLLLVVLPLAGFVSVRRCKRARLGQ